MWLARAPASPPQVTDLEERIGKVASELGWKKAISRAPSYPKV